MSIQAPEEFAEAVGQAFCEQLNDAPTVVIANAVRARDEAIRAEERERCVDGLRRHRAAKYHPFTEASGVILEAIEALRGDHHAK